MKKGLHGSTSTWCRLGNTIRWLMDPTTSINDVECHVWICLHAEMDRTILRWLQTFWLKTVMCDIQMTPPYFSMCGLHGSTSSWCRLGNANRPKRIKDSWLSWQFSSVCFAQTSIQVCSVLPLLLEWQRVSLLHTLPNLGTQMCCVATILSRLPFISTGECLIDVSWERWGGVLNG